jgi:HlyD family secretion protein
LKRWLIVLIPVVALGALIAWRINSKKAEAAAQTQQRKARSQTVALVTVADVQRRDIVQTFEGVGTIESAQNVKIAPKTSGRIEFLQVREGDRVTAGQVLARIDSSEIDAQVNVARANLAEAQSRLAQALINQAPTNVSVTTQIRTQVAAVSGAQADLEQVKATAASQETAAQMALTDATTKAKSAGANIQAAEADVAKAQANLDNSNTKLARINDLYKQGFIAAQDVDDAKADANVKKSELDAAKVQLYIATEARKSAEKQMAAAETQIKSAQNKGKADVAAAAQKVNEARAALEYARANTAQRPAFQQNIEALRSGVDAAKAALETTQARRADTVLTSPLNGSVTARHMDEGSTATPGTPILTIQALKQVWATVSVPEEVSRNVRLGQAATARFDGLPGRTFVGRISQVNPAADPQSRQFVVRVTIDNLQGALKPGMFGRVTLTTDRRSNVLAVPREAVQQTPKGRIVVVVQGDKAQHRPVTLGASDPAGFEIVSGLEPDEKVVTVSAAPVRDGATVRVAGARQAQK